MLNYYVLLQSEYKCVSIYEPYKEYISELLTFIFQIIYKLIVDGILYSHCHYGAIGGTFLCGIIRFIMFLSHLKIKFPVIVILYCTFSIFFFAYTECRYNTKVPYVAINVDCWQFVRSFIE